MISELCRCILFSNRFFCNNNLTTWFGETPMVLWLLKNCRFCWRKMMIRRIPLSPFNFCVSLWMQMMLFVRVYVSMSVVQSLDMWKVQQRTHTHDTHSPRMEQWQCIVFEMQRDNVFVRRHFTNYVTQQECRPIQCVCVRSVALLLLLKLRCAHTIFIYFILAFLLVQAGDANGISPFDRRQLKAYFCVSFWTHLEYTRVRRRLFSAGIFRIYNRYRLFCFSCCGCGGWLLPPLRALLNTKLHNKQLFCRCSAEKDYSGRFGSVRCDAKRCVCVCEERNTESLINETI